MVIIALPLEHFEGHRPDLVKKHAFDQNITSPQSNASDWDNLSYAYVRGQGAMSNVGSHGCGGSFGGVSQNNNTESGLPQVAGLIFRLIMNGGRPKFKINGV